jgi:GT2 family glycosyltransferase
VTAPWISVIVSTYEWPEALDVVLEALSEQTDPALEVIVADDGWRLGRIRNLGALRARGDYFVFLDGDCLVRTGFGAAIRRAALPGWFLASKRLHLSSGLSRRVLEGRSPVWRWSAARWAFRAPIELVSSNREAGSPGVIIPARDRRRPWRRGQPEFAPPFDAYGFFLGVSRGDFEAVNGFDMRYRTWGGEDRDLAARLRRCGLRCGWPGPGATVLHVWHASRKGTMPSNTPLLEETLAAARVEAVEGLRELLPEKGGQSGDLR